MPIAYLDSSATMRLTAEETGSEVAAQLRDGCATAAASRLAYPKTRVAQATAGHHHDLDPGGQAAADQAREEYRSATLPVQLTPAVEQQAGQPAARHALRGTGAVHLASAPALSDSRLILAARDRRLQAAPAQPGSAPLQPIPARNHTGQDPTSTLSLSGSTQDAMTGAAASARVLAGRTSPDAGRRSESTAHV